MIAHTAVIPVAGDQVTNDIAVALKTPSQQAERLKIQYAYALGSLIEVDQSFEVASFQNQHMRSMSQSDLAAFVEPRFRELFELVHTELKRHHLADALGAGIVLTGGSVQMPGVLPLAESVFNRSVRLGVPRAVSGMTRVVHNPVYATAVGLLRYGYDRRNGTDHRTIDSDSAHNSHLWSRLHRWVRGHF